MRREDAIAIDRTIRRLKLCRPKGETTLLGEWIMLNDLATRVGSNFEEGIGFVVL